MTNEISIDAVVVELKRQLGEDQFALALQRAQIAALQAEITAAITAAMTPEQSPPAPQ